MTLWGLNSQANLAPMGPDPAIQAVFFEISALLRPPAVGGDGAGMAGSSPAMTESVMMIYCRLL